MENVKYKLHHYDTFSDINILRVFDYDVLTGRGHLTNLGMG